MISNEFEVDERSDEVEEEQEEQEGLKWPLHKNGLKN